MYVVDGAQPASKFFEQVRVLDPTKMVVCKRSVTTIDSMPGVESVSKEEWKLYVDHLGPQAVKSLKDDEGTGNPKHVASQHCTSWHPVIVQPLLDHIM